MAQNEENENELFMENVLLMPYKHIIQVSGKQYRVRILSAFNHWLQLPKEKSKLIIDSVYMKHNSTLILHNCFVTTLWKQREDKGKKYTGEIQCNDNFQCPTEEQYEHTSMLEQKTGNLLKFCVQVMQLFFTNKTDYSNLARKMRLYFQLRDDYWNLAKTEALEEWPNATVKEEVKRRYYCEDITEGKFTLPIIHAAKQREGEAVLNIFRQHTKDINLKKCCLEQLSSMQHENSIREEILKFGGNAELLTILNEMASAN